MTKMNEAIEIAYRLGFILEPVQYLRSSDMVAFELNPAMCKRYERKQKRNDDDGTMHRTMQDDREQGDDDDDELANFKLPIGWDEDE